VVIRQGDVFWVDLGRPSGSGPGYSGLVSPLALLVLLQTMPEVVQTFRPEPSPRTFQA
jgi:hypothetical protein